MREKRINNVQVKPIPVPKLNPDEVLGYELFATNYSNIFACAKKHSGKTNATFTILKHCINRHTKVHLFVSTANKDDNWLYIREWFKKNKISCDVYLDMSALAGIIKSLGLADEDEVIETEGAEWFTNLEEHKPRERKAKKLSKVAPEHIFIFDDMSKMLRSEAVSALLKANRHIKCKVILSSQYPNDLDVPARKQLDYWLLFKGHSLKKLMEIYDNMDLDIEFETFLALYRYATSRPYSFLYIDTNRAEFRRNFNHLLSIIE